MALLVLLFLQVQWSIMTEYRMSGFYLIIKSGYIPMNVGALYLGMHVFLNGGGGKIISFVTSGNILFGDTMHNTA